MKDKTTSLTCKYTQYTFENTGNRFTKEERKKEKKSLLYLDRTLVGNYKSAVGFFIYTYGAGMCILIVN